MDSIPKIDLELDLDRGEVCRRVGLDVLIVSVRYNLHDRVVIMTIYGHMCYNQTGFVSVR